MEIKCEVKKSCKYCLYYYLKNGIIPCYGNANKTTFPNADNCFYFFLDHKYS